MFTVNLALVTSENQLAIIIGDFGNFLNSFAKTPRLIVLNIDLVQFVLKNCKILHSV